MDPLRIDVASGGEGVRILRLQGPFTLKAVYDFQTAARSSEDPITIIDLTGVPFMDSAALGAILGVHTSCQKQKRKYALVGASARLHTLFEVAGVHQILVSYQSLDDALKALA